jgi:hypothetical protein
MTRAEAEQGARRLQENDPDRETHRFVAREGTGGERRMPGLPGGV